MFKNKFKKSIISILILGLIIQLGMYSNSFQNTNITIESPYNDLNWESTNKMKTNLHTHTNKSDGRNTIQEVINRHSELNYKILSITDHDHLTYPWDDEVKGQKDLQIPRNINSVSGNEFSSKIHHINGFFIEKISDFKNEEDVLEQISKQNGFAHLNHPGRYNKDVSWYTDLFTKYDKLLGLEVINRSDRYKNDRKLWDEVLTEIIHKRNIWGFANSDSHKMEHIDTAYNVMLIEGDFTQDKLRDAMENGKFYFIAKECKENNKQVNLNIEPPTIQKIQVDNEATTIQIDGTNIKQINWIGENGEKVAEGNLIKLKDLQKTKYVRAVVIGEGGVLFTQPFSIIYN